MATGIPIHIMGPKPEGNRNLSATAALGFTQRPNIEDIKLRLKQIRDFASVNNSSLLGALQKKLHQFEDLHIFLADTAPTALDYIKRIAGDIENISINRSSSVAHELKPGLAKLGFSCIDSYFNEFKSFENKVQDYWQLATIKPEELFGSFDITTKMSVLTSSSNEQHKAKNYIALLGVNAASAEEGTLFFMQHLSNISKDLEQARKVILVIGIEKIVGNNEDAIFLTKCMGMFGIQGILLDLLPQKNEYHLIENLPASVNQRDRELHIILLDNGRKTLLESPYRDLFLCIGCRACLKKCPISKSMRGEGAVWSPVNYLKLFKHGEIKTIDLCLHCEGCRLQCPLDIDIPQLMWKAKRNHLAKHRRRLPSMLLDNPEFLAKVGTAFSPISNILLNNTIIRTIMEKTIGIHKKGRMPTFRRQTFRTWHRSQHGNKKAS